MKKLNRTGSAERRAEYARLRLENVSSVEAAAAVGVTDMSTRRLYEHWALALNPALVPEPPRPRPNYSHNEAGRAS